MNAQVLAFDTASRPAGSTLRPLPKPGHDPAPASIPDREWGLSAGQVAAVVVAIVAASEVIGLLF